MYCPQMFYFFGMFGCVVRLAIAAETTIPDSLRVSVISSETVVKSGDILHLGLAIENMGLEPIEFNGMPSDERDTAEWYLLNNNASSRHFVRSLYAHGSVVKKVMLRPGERILVGNLFVVDGRKPEWRPGKWTVSCVLKCLPNNPEVKSTFEIEIVMPASPDELDAGTASMFSSYLNGRNRGVDLAEILGNRFKPSRSQQAVIEYARVKEVIEKGDAQLIPAAVDHFRKACLEMHLLPRQRFLKAIGIKLTEPRLGLCDEARKIEPYIRPDYFGRSGLLQAIDERCPMDNRR